jgi:hypothetical protein
VAMNEHDLRTELLRVASDLPGGSGDVLARDALRRGRARLRQRRQRRSSVLTAVAVVAVGAYALAVPSTKPAEAAVACYPDRVVAHGEAAIGRHGVRLTVTNETSGAVLLLAGDAAAVVPPGRSSVEVALPPGTVAVSCDTGLPLAPAALTVHDPRGLYVDDRVACIGSEVRDLRGDERVERGDPVALTFGRLAGAPAGAAFEPAGYPGAPGRRVVRVRDGARVVAVALWHAMPEPDSWVLDEVHLCDPLRLAP